MRVVAVLETMWGADCEGEEAVRFFKISPSNHSGRRLYKLIGPGNSLTVTNACKEYVTSSDKHGRPDPIWLSENLDTLEGEKNWIDVFLICGKVAQDTYRISGYIPRRARVIEMPHPAARFWTQQMMLEFAAKIAAT